MNADKYFDEWLISTGSKGWFKFAEDYAKIKSIQFIQEVIADGWIQSESSDKWHNTINHKIKKYLILTTDELYDMYFKKGGTE